MLKSGKMDHKDSFEYLKIWNLCKTWESFLLFGSCLKKNSLGCFKLLSSCSECDLEVDCKKNHSQNLRRKFVWRTWFFLKSMQIQVETTWWRPILSSKTVNPSPTTILTNHVCLLYLRSKSSLRKCCVWQKLQLFLGGGFMMSSFYESKVQGVKTMFLITYIEHDSIFPLLITIGIFTFVTSKIL